MHNCPKCGTEFEGKFCPECGTPWQEEKTCPNCGATLKGGAKFCNECGYSFLPQTPAPAKAAVKEKNNDKLYLLLHYLPAILLGLFGLLTFAFLAAPAVKLGIAGLGSASENGYEVLKDQTLSTLKGCFIALLVFACFTAIGAGYTAFVLRKRPAIKLHPVLFFGFAAYLVQFIIACVAIAKIKDLDGGAGMLSAGAGTVLILVFAILCALGTVGAVIGKKFVKSSYSEIEDKINLKDSKTLKWVKTHKALVSALAAFAVIVVVIGSCIPTFLLMGKNGTYYSCYNGEIDEEEYIVLKNGKWTDETGASGKYSLSGNTITVRIHDDFTNTTLSVSGTIKNGVLKLAGEGMNATYRTKGHKHKCVDAENQSSEETVTQKCDCGLVWNYTRGLEYSGNKVTGIGAATGDIVIPYSYKGKTITSIGEDAFNNCSGLTSVTIPNSVTEIGYSAFRDCSGLTSVTIPNSVTEIGYSAFSGCSSLTSVTIPDSVTEIGYSAFSGCSSLTSIIVDENNQHYSSQDGILYNKSKTEFIHVPRTIKGDLSIPNGVTEIGYSAFRDCSGLTSITIPDSVTSIGDYAFYGCHKIIQAENGVEYVDKWVIDCDRSVTSVSLRSDTVGIADSAFSGCSSLTSVTIPNSVTSIGDYAFSGCSGLTSITIPDSVTEIGWNAFSGCSGLTSITIPDSVTSIGDSAFWGCSSLTSIIFKGTKAQWNAIDKDYYWDYGTGNYTVHCTDGDIKK